MLEELRNFLAKHPSIFSFLRKIFENNFKRQKELVRDALQGKIGLNILDIGCGTGEFFKSFQEQSYIGIDICPEYINYAIKTRAGDFLVMDATHLSFSDNSFDSVFIAAMLHHLSDEDVEKVLQEVKRVLKAGGEILVMEDAKIADLDSWLVRFIQKFDMGEFIRTPDEYKRLFLKYFSIQREWQFRNGACTYYAALMGK